MGAAATSEAMVTSEAMETSEVMVTLEVMETSEAMETLEEMETLEAMEILEVISELEPMLELELVLVETATRALSISRSMREDCKYDPLFVVSLNVKDLFDAFNLTCPQYKYKPSSLIKSKK